MLNIYYVIHSTVTILNIYRLSSNNQSFKTKHYENFKQQSSIRKNNHKYRIYLEQQKTI